MKMHRVAAWMLVVGALFLGRAAFAVVYDIDESDLGATGTLNQTQVGANFTLANGQVINNYCAPTATMNSFIFLQNAYPKIYDNNLYVAGTNGNGFDTDGALLASSTYMGTTPSGGTSNGGWIDGKVNYINTYAPGTTYFEGMDSLGNGGQSWVQTANPTANFLVMLLQQGEDVEIDILPAAGIGHVMTLTSIDWDTTQTFFTIDGIDPANPGTPFDLTVDLAGAAGGAMTLTYAGAPYTLVAALGESPIPEPATLSLVLLGGAAIVGRIRRNAA